MNIKPLFKDKNLETHPSAEQMIEMMDLPDEDKGKRAFLNQCSIDEEQKKDWEDLNACLDLGKQMPTHEPDPSIRARVLENAYAEIENFPAREKKTTSISIGFIGWRWAWAALFLIMSWGTYDHFKEHEFTTQEIQQLENEISSIYEEMEWLREDLVYDMNEENEETA